MASSSALVPWPKRLASASPWGCFIFIMAWVCLQSGAAQNLLSFRFAGLWFHESIFLLVPTVGVALTLAGGLVDLSAGAMVCFAGVLMAKLLGSGMGAFSAAATVLGVGCVLHLLQGAVVVSFRAPSILVTFGAMAVLQNASVWAAGENGGHNPDASSFNQFLLVANPENALPIPNGFWIGGAIAAGMAILLFKSIFGRHLLAAGSEASVAYMCGVPVARSRLIAFGVSGLILAAGGLFQNSQMSGGSPGGSVGLEIEMLAALLVGGANWRGGQMSVLRTIPGVMAVALAHCALGLGSVSLPWREAAIAALLAAAAVRSAANAPLMAGQDESK